MNLTKQLSQHQVWTPFQGNYKVSKDLSINRAADMQLLYPHVYLFLRATKASDISLTVKDAFYYHKSILASNVTDSDMYFDVHPLRDFLH